MKFKAEIKEVKQAKKGLDNIYSIKLETDEECIMDLGKIPPDRVVDVEVEPEDG